MINKNIKWISEQVDNSSQVIKSIGTECSLEILNSSRAIIKALDIGNKVLWCGNGGSAGQAQHLSAELVCGLRCHDRRALSSISLTTDTSLITAWSNDVDYESIFSRQIEAIGKEGDVLVSLSTSGNSNNIIQALNIAKKLNLYTIGLTGMSDSFLKSSCDIAITIPSEDTQRIQEGHILAGHLICEIIENYYIDKKGK